MSGRRIDMLPLWTDAYMADTTHLGLDHHGAYMLLLMKAWRMGGSLPDDDMFLRNTLSITQKKWKAIRPVLEPFFMVEDGRWTHKRLTAEYEKARRLSSQKETHKRENGSPKSQPKSPKKPNENNDRPLPYARAEAGAGAGADNIPLNKTPKSSSSSSKERPGVDDDDDRVMFEDFWMAYPSAVVTNKRLAQEAWFSLDPEHRPAALAEAERLRDDGQVSTTYPHTFLNDFEVKPVKPVKATPLPSRPSDPVAAAVFDHLVDAGKAGTWACWFEPCLWDGRTLHPPSGLVRDKLENFNGHVLRQFNLSVGAIETALRVAS